MSTSNDDFLLFDRRILDNESLNGRDKLVLIVLSNTHTISYSDLAKKIGTTRPTAIAAVRSLESKGFLKHSRSNKENKERSSTNKYFVTI